jgi:hypothetical protein
VISPVLPLTEEQDRNFKSDNKTCVDCILTLLSEQLYDIHMHHEVARDLWETLDRMYTESDAGREFYVNEQYHEYRTVDDHSVVEQSHEIQLLMGELAHFDCVLPNKFVVGGIIAKLPPTWRNFAMALKHKKEAMTVESLIATLDVEEKAKSKDVPRYGPMDSGTSNANVVEGKSVGKNKNKSNWKQKAKQNTDFKKKKKNLADLTCFVCGESGHIARKCRKRKGKKGDGQKTANVAIADVGNSRYVPQILLACQSIDWWLDTGANVHVCSDLNLFSSYQATDSSAILMSNGSRVVVHGIGRVDLKLTSGKTLSLKNVQHVLGIYRNFISDSLLCRDGFKLVFESNKFIVSKFGLFIGKGYDSGGLFCLSVADDCNNVANSVSYSELNVGEVAVWHPRLCHISFDRII